MAVRHHVGRSVHEVSVQAIRRNILRGGDVRQGFRTYQVERGSPTMELEDVFRNHQRAVYAYFLRVVGDRHAAEELAQETFVRACGAALRFRGDAPVANWLFGIARHVLLEASRKGLFRREAGFEGIDPAAAEVDHDERIDLERAFGALSHLDRETLVLVDLLGFSPTEAAELMTAEPGTFRMRLNRARRRLREQLEVRTP